jgi:hypothetical protein
MWPTAPQPPGSTRNQPAPVVVTASPPEVASALQELLSDHRAVLVEPERIELELADSARRGTVIYRVVQASLSIATAFPRHELYLLTEDGNRWRLPPPAL